MSLVSSSSPRAIEPNTRTFRAPCFAATCRISSRLSRSRSLDFIAQLPQVSAYRIVKSAPLRRLISKLGHEPLHLLLERLAVILGRLRADVAARSEDVTMLADVVELRRHAVAWHVREVARVLVAAPGVVGAGDPGDVGVGQLAVHAVDHRTHFARVDEEGLAAPVTEAAVTFAAREEPEADRNLRRVEELARECHHAVHQVCLDDGLADLTFT